MPRGGGDIGFAATIIRRVFSSKLRSSSWKGIYTYEVMHSIYPIVRNSRNSRNVEHVYGWRRACPCCTLTGSDDVHRYCTHRESPKAGVVLGLVVRSPPSGTDEADVWSFCAEQNLGVFQVKQMEVWTNLRPHAVTTSASSRILEFKKFFNSFSLDHNSGAT